MRPDPTLPEVKSLVMSKGSRKGRVFTPYFVLAVYKPYRTRTGRWVWRLDRYEGDRNTMAYFKKKYGTDLLPMGGLHNVPVYPVEASFEEISTED